MFEQGTIQLAKVAGIPVRLHWSFMFIILWVWFTAWKDGSDLMGTLYRELFVLVIFLCVILHEYGHALVARKFGHKTQDILLTPIGGIARLESLSDNPKQELLIALAGPMVNVIIAGIIYTVMKLTGKGFNIFLDESNVAQTFQYSFFPLVLTSNVMLALFNMIPAFPMDGGRVLRSLLSFKWPRLKATAIAARIGQFIAVIAFALALYTGQYMLCLISAFVFFNAGSELKQMKWDGELVNKAARDLYQSPYDRIDALQPMQVTVDLIRRGIEKNYLVFQDDRYIGYLSIEAILLCIKKKLTDRPVIEFTKIDNTLIDPNESLKNVSLRMQTKNAPILPVGWNDHILGSIEEYQIKKYVELRLNSEI